jgi:hypothetical protein
MYEAAPHGGVTRKDSFIFGIFEEINSNGNIRPETANSSRSAQKLLMQLAL